MGRVGLSRNALRCTTDELLARAEFLSVYTSELCPNAVHRVLRSEVATAVRYSMGTVGTTRTVTVGIRSVNKRFDHIHTFFRVYVFQYLLGFVDYIPRAFSSGYDI